MSTPTNGASVYSSFLHGMKQETKIAYLKDLRDFARFCCGVEQIEALETFMFRPGADLIVVAEAVRAYRAQMVGRGLHIGTVRRRLAAVRGLSKKAADMGVVQWTLDSLGLARSARRRLPKQPQDPAPSSAS